MEMPATKVRNRTRGTILVEDLEWADTFWRRAKGLLGRRKLRSGTGLAIFPCQGVHMWGMSFAIDVVYVSASGLVVDCVARLQPWRFGPLVRRAAWVLELPVGTIAATGTCIGDRLELDSNWS